MTTVELTVKRHPKKRGYTIYHNQKVGWKGCKQKYFGWYKFKSDATQRKNELQKSYN